jgi:hypothetical protein
MPKIPERILSKMADSADFNTEEFVARRVFRGMGLVGKQTDQAKKVFQRSRQLEDWPAAWSVAQDMLKVVSNYIGTPISNVTDYQVRLAADIKEALEIFHDVYPDTAQRACMLIRIGDSVMSLLLWYPEDIGQFDPPFHVYPHTSGRMVLVCKDAVQWIESYGPYEEPIQNMLGLS